MKELLALPIEVQIVLFAGYVGYQISTIGRAVSHKTEDVFLQVIAFGTIGRLTMALLLSAAATLFPEWTLSETGRLAVIGIGTFLATFSSAYIWRKKLNARVAKWMGERGVYQDDHESSTWRSILATKARWSYVQLHCDDGRVYETNFQKLPDCLPGARIVLNDDGVAMYVTQFFRADDTFEEVDVSSPEHGVTLDFFPKATIRRVEIGWLS